MKKRTSRAYCTITVVGLLALATACDRKPAPTEKRAPAGVVREPALYSMTTDDGSELPAARFELGEPSVRIDDKAVDLGENANHVSGLRALREANPAIQTSECLSRAAEIYAAYHGFDVQTEPPRAFVEAALHWAGCPDSAAAVRLYYTTEDDDVGFRNYSKSKLGLEKYTHVGVGRAPATGDPYRWTWAVFLTKRKFSLDPLPRVVDVGGTHTMRFRLTQGLKEPDVLTMSTKGNVDAGAIDQVDVHVVQDGSFEADLRFDAEGEYWVEILANGDLGPEVVALFPVYVGVEPPSDWRGPLPPDESWIRTPSDAEALAFDLINDDRASFGLPPLKYDETLSAVARKHSQNMRDAGFFAHISPQFGTLGDRLSAVGYEARTSAENIAKNGSLNDAQVGLMQSLGHRANILSLDPSHAGVGVAMGVGANGTKTYFITQNFARPLARPTEEAVIRDVVVKVNEQRKVNGTRPATTDPRVDEIALNAARDAVRGGFDARKMNGQIQRGLDRNGIGYKRFITQYQQVLELEDISLPAEVGAGRRLVLGVGVVPTVDEGTQIPVFGVLLLLVEQ